MNAPIPAAAIAAAATSPALARTGETMRHLHHNHTFTQAHASFANTPARGSIATPDPNGVCVNGMKIGADPDPNVRSSLRDEYYTEQVTEAA